MSIFNQADLANEIEFEFANEIEFEFESVPCATPPIPLKERVFAGALMETLRCNLRETIHYPIWMRGAYMDDPFEMDLYFNEELQQSFLDTIEASDLIVNQIAKAAQKHYFRTQKHYFRTQIAEELIAEAMHPRRMMTRISQFDDIESFFECC